MNQEPKRGHFAKEKGEIILREHEYDGIQEYDQKLPNWWLFTFYGAVVWFVIHWAIYYHTDLIKSPGDRVKEDMTMVFQQRAADLEKTLASLDDSTLVHEWAAKPDVVAAGEGTYLTYCAACHASDLSATMNSVALPGLPLNDGKWKYGGKPMQLFNLINKGTPPESQGHNGARMQAWGQSLSAKQIAEVTAYLIHSLPADFKSIPPPP